jgi:hypothetical protein
MAQKRQAKQSLIKRLRARLKKQSQTLKQKTKTSMAYGRKSWKPRFPSFRRRSNYGGGQRRNYSGGGISRRVPILGFRLPNLLIWIAIIGGGIFFGKDLIKPMIDKLKNKV